jgi:peptide/nickel transport system ATP-binding protein
MTDPLLSVRNLRTHFHTVEGTVRAVDGVSFDIHRGETVCLVGESGSGKTVACESITKLIDSPPGEIDGEIVFDGRDLTDLGSKEMRTVRGAHIGYVFQNPQGALDPVYTVGSQIVETLTYHRDVSKSEARELAIDLMARVGIPEPSSRFGEYPHQFSGGMVQRLVIAMALAPDPDLLIADEPTTALDVTTQAGILRLLRDLQDDLDMAILFVTHDLGVVAEMADRVVVLYAGKVMERGDVHAIFDDPAHPYTRALLECVPGQGGDRTAIGGQFPSPIDPPAGCRFHTRCPHAVEACRTGEQPPFESVDGDPGHVVSCVYYGEGYDASAVRGDAETVRDLSEESEHAADGGTADRDPAVGGTDRRTGGDGS